MDWDLDDLIVSLTGDLRRSGVAVSAEQAVAFKCGLALIDASSLTQIYWCARTTLVADRGGHEIFDGAFGRLLGLHGSSAQDVPDAVHEREDGSGMAPGPKAPESRGNEGAPGTLAGAIDVVRQKDFAVCTDDELRQIAVVIEALRLSVPQRVTQRWRPAKAGRSLDMPRTIRQSIRTSGEVIALKRRTRVVVRREVILVVDISGSMRDYSRTLLHFAVSVARAIDAEVFAVGTRLTRLTKSARRGTIYQAVETAIADVEDWEGGTQLGQALALVQEVVPRRGALIVVVSDGLDGGDLAVLERALVRARRSARRLVWATPLMRNTEYQPVQRATRIVARHVDELVPAHNLASLEELAALFRRE